MDRRDRLELGEKLIVLGVLGVFLVEMLFTIIAMGVAFSWTALLLGIFATCFIAYLGQQLYAGKKGEAKLAQCWASFMLFLSVVALVTLAAGHGQAGIATHLGLPVMWMALIKVGVYAGLLAILFVPQSVKDFVVVKGGGELALQKEEKPLEPSGLTVALADNQKQAVDQLSRGLTCAGVTLVIAGVLRLLMSLPELNRQAAPGFLSLLEGCLIAALGGLLLLPSRAWKMFQANNFDMAYLMNALVQLKNFFQKAALIVLGLVLVLALMYAWVQTH